MCKTEIDISKYVGLLIQENPEILIEEPILAIEYNQDGSTKDIGTLIDEFNQRVSTITREDDNNEYRNIYSIYYGIISKNKEQVTPELEEKVMDFYRQVPIEELVPISYLRNLVNSKHEDKGDLKAAGTNVIGIQGGNVSGNSYR